MSPTNWQTYLVTQASLSEGRSTVEIVEAAIEGGIDVVQLREKNASARERYVLGQKLRALTDEAGVPLLVNDRIDLAMAINADGVHLGQSDIPVTVARDLLGPDAIIGCSTSYVETAQEAEEAGADYLGVGAVYQTGSKPVDDETNGIGPERIAEIADAVSIPVIGIGGIIPDNARAVVEAGATGVSVISAITTADDPAAATESLRSAVE